MSVTSVATSSKISLDLEKVEMAKAGLDQVIIETPLVINYNLSEQYQANVLLKREDTQVVRSYKIRGAYNKISHLSAADQSKGVVCASAGNHAQGVAMSCQILNIPGVIFMPAPTPTQKVDQVKMFGRTAVDIHLTGDTFDDAQAEALAYCQKHGLTFIPPFDDEKVIEGQATIALEVLKH